MEIIQGDRGCGKINFMILRAERIRKQREYYRGKKIRIFITYIVVVLFGLLLVMLNLMPPEANIVCIITAFVIQYLINKRIDKKIEELN